jgi:cation diffusion facilitator family transporter
LEKAQVTGSAKNRFHIATRTGYGKLGAWASILLNFVLFIVKGILGLITGSLSLIADAFHTLSDMGTSIIVLVSFYIVAKPSDKEHPFGHGRAEFISAIIMSTILAITSFELLKSSIDRILHPKPFLAAWWVIGIILLTVVLKEGLAFFSRSLARKINSPALKADAWHHHLDAISSLFVVIAFIFSHFNFPNLDGPAGILITLIILYSAYSIAKGPIDNLLGVTPDEKILDQIEEITLRFPEVKGIHDIIVHNYGEIRIITLHIEIEENLSFVRAHQIAENVDKTLRQELNAYVTVHYDPVMRRTPTYLEIEKKLQEFCRTTKECHSFHDLRIYGRENNLRVMFDIVSDPNIKNISERKLIEQCQQYLMQEVPEIKKVIIKVEPKFSISRKSRHNES